VVTDVDNNDCSTFIEYGEICCEDNDFNFSQVEFELSECENNEFNLSFLYNGALSNEIELDLFLNGNYVITFSTLESFSFTINNALITNIESIEIRLCESANQDNCEDFLLNNPCYISSVNEGEVSFQVISIIESSLDNLVINNLLMQQVNYQIINMKGELVLNSKLLPGINNIDFIQTKGVYVLHFVINDKTYFKKIFIY
jgi:hypothetical protein